MKSLTILSTAARSAIASAYLSALNAQESSGSLIHTVCEVANRYTKGAAMADEDIKATVTDISKAKGWKGKSAASRESEVRVVLRAAHLLPDAIDAATKAKKVCDWHTGMRIARALNKGKTQPQAIKAAYETGSANKGTPEGRVAGALKGWYKVSPRKRESILKAADLLGIKLGIKLDA